MHRFSIPPEHDEDASEIASLHCLVEHYRDSGELPADTVANTRLRERTKRATGQGLPKELRPYLFELSEDIRGTLEHVWHVAHEDREMQLKTYRKTDLRAADGEFLREPDCITGARNLYEVRCVVPYWGGYENVELTFRQLSRREPTDRFEELIDDHDTPVKDSVYRRRCDHPSCRTPDCTRPHWIFGSPDTFGPLERSHLAALQLFTFEEARVLEIVLPCVFGWSISRRRVYLPMR